MYYNHPLAPNMIQPMVSSQPYQPTMMTMPSPVMMAPQNYYALPPTPVYYPQPQAPVNNPQVIVIKKQNRANKSLCHLCNEQTLSLPKKLLGSVAFMWCLGLSLCGLCFIPIFCTDSCKDTQMVCIKCQSKKHKIEARCC